METPEPINQETPPEVNPIFDKAKAAGWKPLEEFEGDPDQWVDAKEFVGRAPLYEKNHKLKKELNDLKSTLHEVKTHISKVSQAAYNKAVADLTAQRDAAIEEGDKAQVKEIDKALKDAESIKTPIENVHPAIKEWEAENATWFYADPEINNFGMAMANSYLVQHPNDFPGAVAAMDKALRKAYPDKYEPKQDKRKDPPAVEGGKRGEGKKTFTRSDLNDEQRRVMNTFVRQGIMTEDDYIKELADSGVIGGKK
jgi:hypothetical protein